RAPAAPARRRGRAQPTVGWDAPWLLLDIQVRDPADAIDRQHARGDLTHHVLHRDGALELVAHVAAGVQGVGAVVAHQPQVVIRHGDGAEVLALAGIGAGCRVHRVHQRAHRVGIVHLLAVDHHTGVAGAALDSLPTGGDDSLDQGVFIRGLAPDHAAGVPPALDRPIVRTLGDVGRVPGTLTDEDDDVPRLRLFSAEVGALIDEDPVIRAPLAAVQGGLH